MKNHYGIKRSFTVREKGGDWAYAPNNTLNIVAGCII